MPIGSFADDGKIEAETIILGRGLLEIEEVHLNYGNDPEKPAPYEVENKKGEVIFTSDPNISALVQIVDDYGDGSMDGKKFWDKFYLKENKKKPGVWEAGENSKLGMALKAHPKYGPKHFEAKLPKPVNEKDLEGFQFEAGTEQKEDRSGKKIEGTRIAWLSIGAVPDRDKKKKARKEADEQIDKEVEDQLSEADEAKMDEVFEAASQKAS
jgi:hypothetical protein